MLTSQFAPRNTHVNCNCPSQYPPSSPSSPTVRCSNGRQPTRKKDVGGSAEERRRCNNLSYWAIGWLTLAHLVVLAAPFTFTWTGLIVASCCTGSPVAWGFASGITDF